MTLECYSRRPPRGSKSRWWNRASIRLHHSSIRATRGWTAHPWCESLASIWDSDSDAVIKHSTRCSQWRMTHPVLNTKKSSCQWTTQSNNPPKTWPSTNPYKSQINNKTSKINKPIASIKHSNGVPSTLRKAPITANLSLKSTDSVMKMKTTQRLKWTCQAHATHASAVLSIRLSKTSKGSTIIITWGQSNLGRFWREIKRVSRT